MEEWKEQSETFRAHHDSHGKWRMRDTKHDHSFSFHSSINPDDCLTKASRICLFNCFRFETMLICIKNSFRSWPRWMEAFEHKSIAKKTEWKKNERSTTNTHAHTLTSIGWINVTASLESAGEHFIRNAIDAVIKRNDGCECRPSSHNEPRTGDWSKFCMGFKFSDQKFYSMANVMLRSMVSSSSSSFCDAWCFICCFLFFSFLWYIWLCRMWLFFVA